MLPLTLWAVLLGTWAGMLSVSMWLCVPGALLLWALLARELHRLETPDEN